MRKKYKRFTAFLIAAIVGIGAVNVRGENADISKEIKEREVIEMSEKDNEIQHRVLISGSNHDRIALIEKDGSTIWELQGLGSLWTEVNDADLLENGNLIFASRDDEKGSSIQLIRPDYEEQSGYELLWEYEVPKGAEAHTCQPIDNGGFLVGEAYNDYIRIVELDANGNIRKTVGSQEKKIESFDETGGTHGKIRQVTKTKDGTYLAVNFSKDITVEFDENGDTVRTYPFGMGFMAVKQENGNVLISGGNTPALKEYNEQGELVWEIGKNDITGVTIGFAAAIDILPNGNIVLANWGGHGGASGVSAVVEINRDKELVWYLPTEDGGNISNVQVFDDMNVDFTPDTETEIPDESSEYRSPLDVVTSMNTGMVYVADHTNCSIQVIRSSTDTLIDVISLPYKPTSLLLSENGRRLYVAAGGANGKVLEINTNDNTIMRTLKAGHTPSAMALSKDETKLYVVNRFDGTLQEMDLESGEIFRQTEVTREPMAVERVGEHLFVVGHLPVGSTNEEIVSSEVVRVDIKQLEDRGQHRVIKLANGSTNLKDMAVSPDQKYIYVTHVLGRNMVATTQEDRGWIYTNAISEIDVNSGKVTATMLIDDLDLGAANPWGIEVTSDEIFLTVSGTKELMIIDRNKMREKIDKVSDGTGRVQGLLESAEDIAADLTFLTEMKTRIKLNQDGPRGLSVMGNKVYVANYYGSSVSVVNSKTKTQHTIVFQTTAQDDDARIGEKLWNDATIGYQQWQSCASCHPDARADALNWDNLNDGIGTPKQARTMLDTFERGRVMATGIRPDAYQAVRAGLKYIMFKKDYPEENLQKIDAYLQSLLPETSPYLEDGMLSESALRGKSLFEGEAGCASCHTGEIKGQDTLIYNFTQTGNEERGLLVPPLREVWRTAPYLHDGRAATIREVLVDYNPLKEDGMTLHGNVQDLSESELNDLITYVLSLSNEKWDEKGETLEELRNLILTAQDKLSGDYTQESKDALMKQIELAEVVLNKGEEASIEELQSAYAQLDAAIKGLIENAKPNKEVLLKLYNENKDKTQGNYTNESWSAFVEALDAAKKVLEDDGAEQKDVDSAVKILQNAIDNLKEKKPEPEPETDKKELQSLYDAYKDMTQGNYTDDSWSALEKAREKAEKVLQDANATQKQVDEARDTLKKAIQGLTEKLPDPVDKSILQKLYEEGTALKQGNYTEESWKRFEEALKTAKEVLDNPTAVQGQVDAAAQKLEVAKKMLEEWEVDKSTLKAMLTLAQGYMDSGALSQLTEEEVQTFEKALKSAEKVYGDLDVSQTEVDASWKQLLAVIQSLPFEKNEKSELLNLVTKASALDLDRYQDGEAKENFNQVFYKAVEALVAEEISQSELNVICDTLKLAMEALIPAVAEVNKSALEAVMSEAESYVLSDYVDGEKEKQLFKDALDSAKAVFENEYATQSEVDQARLNLLIAMGDLRLRADKSSLKSWIERMEKTEFSLYTKESAEALKKAIAEAKELLKKDLSEEESSLIQKAITNMRSAYEGLKQKVTSGISKEDVPAKTGDDMNSTLPIAVLFAAGFILLHIANKKYCKNEKEGNKI